MSELSQETITNGVTVKQEEESILEPSLVYNQDSDVKQEHQDIKTEVDESFSFVQNQPAISMRQQLVAPKRKNKVAVTVKTLKPSSSVQGGLSPLSPGEAMLRCFQTFNIPVRKTLPQPSQPKHKNKFSKKSTKRPPPGLIPLQPPPNTPSPSLNDEAWEGQANNGIISALPHAKWPAPSSLGGHWMTDGLDGITLTPEMKVLRCDICNYVTNRTNNLNRHYNSMHVTLVQPEECCDVVFYTRADLTKHTRLCHPDSKFPCQYPGCQGYVFDRKALLKRHVLAVHLKDKPFLCPMCQYGSSHKSNLDRHMKTKHGMDPAMNAAAASALNASPAGILEGKNLESVDDFLKLMMERAALANIIHNAAFGNVDDMISGLGPVKIEDSEGASDMKTSPVLEETPDFAETREITPVKSLEIPGLLEESEEMTPGSLEIPGLLDEPHEMTPDLDDSFEMTPYLEDTFEAVN